MSRASTLSGFTTAIGQPTNLNVGVITAVTVSSANVLFDDNLTTKQLTAIGLGVTNLNVSGVSTFSGIVNADSDLNANTINITDNIVHRGDTNTSIRFPAADTFTVETAGSERLRITSAGDVGIGTDTPAHKLDIIGGLQAKDGNSGIRFEEVSNGAWLWLDGADGDFHGGDYYGIAANHNAQLQFGYAGAAHLVLDSAGLVGISSTVPKTDLDISQKTGAVALPQGTTAQRPSTAYGGYIRWNSTSSALEVYNGTNWVEIISDYFPSGSTTLG